MDIPADHPIVKVWLSGTTCSGYSSRPRKAVMFENDTHIVLRHYSHSEYLGQFQGSQTCEAYAQLFDKATILTNRYELSTGYWASSPEVIKQWNGRLAPAKIRQECAALGIVFDQPLTSTSP